MNSSRDTNAVLHSAETSSGRLATARQRRATAKQLGWALATLLLVGLLTVFNFRLLHSNSATAGFSYLILVLALAIRVGAREAILASFASVAAYNFYFLPPVGTFTIADPQNWVALFAFLVTALTTSHLSTRSRRQAIEAEQRQWELQRMYEFSRALLLTDEDRTVAAQSVHQLAAIFQVQRVALYDAADGSIARSANTISSSVEAAMRTAALSGSGWSGNGGKTRILPLLLGGRSRGSLAVEESAFPSDVVLQALAQLIAIAMERSRAQAAASLLEATRENERLKSTLLDALAHEFKTPLTSVKAAATTLLSQPGSNASQRELLTIVDEEANRLITLVSDAIELARIDISEVDLHKESCNPAQLVRSVATELRPLLEERPLQIDIDDELGPVLADSRLTQLVLRQLLLNAIRYSPTGSPITIRAEAAGDGVLFRIGNTGYGIPKSEQTLVFQKFYRGKQTRGRTAGTGMGLSIARDIIQAHGGHIWVESELNQGVDLYFSLPLAPAPVLALAAQDR